MKQYITEKQLKELSPKGLHSLEALFNKGTTNEKNWWNVSTLEINIGWMIEFLDESNPLGKGFSQIDATKGTDGLNYFWVFVQYDKHYRKSELCDALWEAVKEVLNED